MHQEQRNKMLIVGPYWCLNQLDETFDIYNYSGMVEGIQYLQLFPPFGYDEVYSKEFDIAYMNYIIENDVTFHQFFQVIESLYQGRNVYILVSSDEQLKPVEESFIKIIQQRYGYNYQWINDIEDINIYDESSFSLEGLRILEEIDLPRYMQYKTGTSSTVGCVCYE